MERLGEREDDFASRAVDATGWLTLYAGASQFFPTGLTSPPTLGAGCMQSTLCEIYLQAIHTAHTAGRVQQLLLSLSPDQATPILRRLMKHSDSTGSTGSSDFASWRQRPHSSSSGTAPGTASREAPAAPLCHPPLAAHGRNLGRICAHRHHTTARVKSDCHCHGPHAGNFPLLIDQEPKRSAVW